MSTFGADREDDSFSKLTFRHFTYYLTIEQHNQGDQLSQILAKLNEQSDRMSRQEEFITQQNAAIAAQTETLQRLQQENQELQQKIDAIVTKKPENHEIHEEDIPQESDIPEGGKGKNDKENENNSSNHTAGFETEESTKTSTYTGDTRQTEMEHLKKKVQTLEKTILQIPRVRKPFESARLGSYSDSPFIDQIALVDLPDLSVFPVLPKYSGKTYPDEHMAQYRQIMMAAVIPAEKRQAAMCHGFGISLIGHALS